MSTEREVVDVATGATLPMSEAIKADPAEFQRLRAEKKARLARILERGMVADRLAVELPADVYGEWVANDPSEIYRMKILGFEIDREYATSRALHSEGDGKSIVGDTVFMICDRDTKDLLDEIRRENFEAMNGKPGSKTVRRQAEEREFRVASETVGMPVVEESVSRTARKAELEAALSKANQGQIQTVAAKGPTIIK